MSKSKSAAREEFLEQDTPLYSEPPLRFNLKRKIIPIVITDNDEEEKEYELREMNGRDRDEYSNFVNQKIEPGKNGSTGHFKSVDRLQSNLIHRCLFDPSSSKMVAEDVIQTWPASMQTLVFERCQELNGLKEKAEEAKNG